MSDEPGFGMTEESCSLASEPKALKSLLISGSLFICKGKHLESRKPLHLSGSSVNTTKINSDLFLSEHLCLEDSIN